MPEAFDIVAWAKAMPPEDTPRPHRLRAAEQVAATIASGPKGIQICLAMLLECTGIATDKIKELRGLIRTLDAQVTELKAAPFEYCGVHEPQKTYRKGQFVTHGGSLWHCERTTMQKPGDSNAWSLAVKRGNDGKDAR